MSTFFKQFLQQAFLCGTEHHHQSSINYPGGICALALLFRRNFKASESFPEEYFRPEH